MKDRPRRRRFAGAEDRSFLSTPLDRKEPQMIRARDSIVNPVTGERLVFELTSHDTGGEYTLFDTFVEPGGAVASAHVHPYQTEIFTVIEGRLGVKRGREKLELAPGEKALIDPGTPHKFWNAGDEPLRFRAEARPAAAGSDCTAPLRRRAAPCGPARPAEARARPRRAARQGGRLHADLRSCRRHAGDSLTGPRPGVSRARRAGPQDPSPRLGDGQACTVVGLP